ncbi:malonyl-CoA synthase [Zavarzinia sp.]|uniref:malonate--CoA ligase n=1 Tax=Zavarzinia sp. TaxID=2027920 RepID=UPI003566198D
MNLFNLFRQRLDGRHDHPFIATPDGRRFTYGDMLRETAAMAGALTAAGIRAGDRVAVQVDKSPHAVFLYLACLRAGAVYLPLNTAYRPDELSYFLGDAEPAAVVCAPEAVETVGAIAARCGIRTVHTLDTAGGGSLAEAAAAGTPLETVVERDDDDVAALLYSSGTTGRPKGAMMSHRNLASNALTLSALWGFTAGDVLLHALPIFHTHGLFIACNIVLVSGAQMIFLPRFDAGEVIARLPQATVFMGVPTFYTRLLAEPAFTAEAAAPVRLFISGSAPLLPAVFDAFAARTAKPILERYGMTETGMLTSNPLNGARRAGTVGKVLPDVELRVAGENDQPQGRNQIGELQVRGPNVFQGYWHMPEKTAAEFTADGFFRTGDLGLIDDEDYVHIVGRSKDLIISGGYNVYPREIELLINALPGVEESAVVGMPHPDFGEAGLAVIVPRAGVPVPDAAAVLASLKDKLANYKVPKQAVVVPNLPRNAMGKVQKNLLRDTWADKWAAGL